MYRLHRDLNDKLKKYDKFQDLIERDLNTINHQSSNDQINTGFLISCHAMKAIEPALNNLGLSVAFMKLNDLMIIYNISPVQSKAAKLKIIGLFKALYFRFMIQARRENYKINFSQLLSAMRLSIDASLLYENSLGPEVRRDDNISKFKENTEVPDYMQESNKSSKNLPSI